MKLSHAILVVALLCLGDVSFANTSDFPELICQFDKSTMIKEKLKKAQECINNGNYSGAKNYLNGVLKLDPNNAKAKELLAVIIGESLLHLLVVIALVLTQIRLTEELLLVAHFLFPNRTCLSVLMAELKQ